MSENRFLTFMLLYFVAWKTFISKFVEEPKLCDRQTHIQIYILHTYESKILHFVAFQNFTCVL